jgi:hypothetical protein
MTNLVQIGLKHKVFNHFKTGRVETLRF